MNKSKPRAAIVYHFYPHYRSGVFLALERRGKVSQHLFGQRTDPFSEIEPWDIPPDIEFTETPIVSRNKTLIWQSKICSIWRDSEIEHVIFLGNAAWLSTWIAAALCRLSGKRVYFWTHGWVAPDSGLKRIVRSMFYSLPHRLLVYGPRAKRLGIETGFPEDRITVVFNSIDVDQIFVDGKEGFIAKGADIRREMFGDAKIPVIACSSRLTRVRRLDLLIDAVAKLREKGREMQVLLIGDGPERSLLESMARDHGVRVYFAGAVYDMETIRDYMSTATVTVAPGKVGLTCMQSLNYGIPVITHDNADNQMPEYEAIIPGRTGAFYREGDSESLASVIDDWTQTSFPSPDVRAACIATITEQWNPDNQAQIIERVITGKEA